MAGVGVSPEWIKVIAIAEALDQGFPWVFWIDTDSVFSDPDRNLDDIVRKKKTIVVSGDEADICNTGHIFVRNTPEAQNLIASWWALRAVPFPPLHTTHIDDKGFVNDQPAFNYLLAGGLPGRQEVSESAERLFNRLNGYTGNADRRHKHFSFTHAPTRWWRVPMAMSLMSRSMRKMVAIVPQGRLNGYPRRAAGSPRSIKNAPIMHYSGPRRKYLKAELERLDGLYSAGD